MSNEGSLSRRRLLNTGRILALGAIPAVAGCGVGSRRPAESPRPPTPEIRTRTVEPFTMPELRSSFERVIDEYNALFNTAISKNEILSKLVLIDNESDYIAKSKDGDPDYKPGRELFIPAFVPFDNHEIVFYSKAMEYALGKVPAGPRARDLREAFKLYIVSHELAHASAAPYDSAQIHNVASTRLHNEYKQIEKVSKNVKGADVKIIGDGKPVYLFGVVEESEADKIGELLSSKRALSQGVQFPVHADAGHISGLMEQLLQRVSSTREDALRMFARERTLPGGRDRVCERIGEVLGYNSSQRLWAGLDVFNAINRNNPQELNRLLNTR